jgi:ABC-type transport system involved in multi-copper enzyme maturation permease subunit
MTLHLIRIIAEYEMRTLLRSWFFRIFAGGAIIGLGIFNIAMNVAASGAPLIYRALASSVPYVNLIILNLGQAVVAIFLGSEFLKQDRKNDTVEVIYARSMTNGQYIIGKTFGVLGVFMILNVFILLMGIGFSFISNVTNQNIPAYFAYILLISIPTLVFILGLSFFIMVIVKNQAVTFILLAGYIALTVFYLNKKAYHIFDYIAYQVPMLYSSISGFSRPLEIFLHRGIYFLLGLGLISLTVYKLKRLPQSRNQSIFALTYGIILILLATGMTLKYLDLKTSVNRYRDQIMVLNNQYVNHLIPEIDSCHLDLVHNGKSIQVIASLDVSNNNSQILDTLIFRLNPDLHITEMTLNGSPVYFKRDMHIISVFAESGLKSGESARLIIKYEGGINENIAFSDLENKKFTENPVFEVARLDKRFAFLKKNFVCLTAETLWYPLAGGGYSNLTPMKNNAGFVNYSLKVKTREGLTPISQGNVTSFDDGSVLFKPEYALPKITLLIGEYIKHTIDVDSLQYSIYTIKGNDYYSSFFPDAADTIPTLINELKKEFEAGIGMKYPFRRLTFAEVPIQLSLDNHIYSYTSDAVQPEIILCPEKGILFSSSDFRGRKYRLEKDMKNNNEEVLPVVVQADLFRQFFRENFMAKRDQHFNYDQIVNWHTFSIYPQYISFYARISNGDWPVLAIALESYLSERNNKVTSTLQWYEDLSAAEKINIELRDATLEDLLKKGIESEPFERNPITITDVVQVKGISLFNMLGTRFGAARLDTMINNVIKDHAHQLIPFDYFSEKISEEFEISFREELNSWYSQKNLPGYIIRNLNTYKVPDGEITKYQVRFQVSNPEDADGIITINIEFNDPNRQRDSWDPSFTVDFSEKLRIPAKTSFEAGYAFNSEPARMSVVTHISRNLPNNLVYNFSGFTETRNTAVLDSVHPIPFFSRNAPENEIIADNEDDYFSYQQALSQAYLKSLVSRKKGDRYKYTSIWWNPPRDWRAVLRSEFYGDYVRSAYYTRGGSGERTATWKAALPDKGTYDVYFHVDKVSGWRRNNRAANYNLTVYHDQGEDKINHSTENADPGWNYIGSWYISSDTARLDVSNKTNGEMVFADAVKWVLNK